MSKILVESYSSLKLWPQVSVKPLSYSMILLSFIKIILNSNIQLISRTCKDKMRM